MSSLAQSVRFAWRRATGNARPCAHVGHIRVGPTDATSCPACAVCGEIGCCDSSRNRHARRRAVHNGHLLIRSAKAGGDWVWRYDDARAVARFEGGTNE